jgi:hypothetical protein
MSSPSHIRPCAKLGARLREVAATRQLVNTLPTDATEPTPQLIDPE